MARNVPLLTQNTNHGRIRDSKAIMKRMSFGRRRRDGERERLRYLEASAVHDEAKPMVKSISRRSVEDFVKIRDLQTLFSQLRLRS